VIPGDSVQINAVVHNFGADAVSAAKVEVWDDSTASLIDSVRVDVPAGGTASFQLPWHVTWPDRHSIRVTVDPFALAGEASYSNNSGALDVVLGDPLGVDGAGPSSRLGLAPAMPNPWNGQTRLRFSLAHDGPATVIIYDLLGRRIRHWSWPQISAGLHEVSWDGRTDGGQAVPPSVLFYRLEADGQVLRQKMIHRQ
jgi:hypothetical protein